MKDINIHNLISKEFKKILMEATHAEDNWLSERTCMFLYNIFCRSNDLNSKMFIHIFTKKQAEANNFINELIKDVGANLHWRTTGSNPYFYMYQDRRDDDRKEKDDIVQYVNKVVKNWHPYYNSEDALKMDLVVLGDRKYSDSKLDTDKYKRSNPFIVINNDGVHSQMKHSVGNKIYPAFYIVECFDVKTMKICFCIMIIIHCHNGVWGNIKHLFRGNINSIGTPRQNEVIVDIRYNNVNKIEAKEIFKLFRHVTP